MKKFIPLILILLFIAGGCAFISSGDNQLIEVKHLLCNGSDHPVCAGQDPLFGWELTASGYHRQQSAYQLLVATSLSRLNESDADSWNSGKIISTQSQWIRYIGQHLDPGEKYYWTVRVWDEGDRASVFGKPASFIMTGRQEDMEAAWISDSAAVDGNPGTSAAPLFRKPFMLEALPKKAIIRYTGVGYIDMYINGTTCSDAVLQPSFTRYDKRVEFETADITAMLVKGENVLACMAGNGFYNVDTRSAWRFNRAPWRGRPAIACVLDIEMKNGEHRKISTDESWKTAPGPVIFNQIRNGETYDAGRDQKGWNSTPFDDGKWGTAVSVAGPEGKLTPAIIPPMRKIRYLKAVKITSPSPGIWLFDFGQNLTGWTKLSFSGRPGDEVVIKHGERIDSSGYLDQKELSRFIFTGETQTSRYLSNGTGRQEWEPRFTYYGFRYAEVSGLKAKPDEETLQACVVYTDFKPAGELHTGNEMIDKLHENTRWSYLGNFHSIPEDCPHREKMGWTGDGQLVAGTGMMNFYTYNGYRKWLNDFTDEQKQSGDLPGIIPTSGWGYEYGRDPETQIYGYGPQWEGACITIPWKLFQYYGDTSVLKDYAPMMNLYMKWLGDISKGDLLNIGIDDHKSLVSSDPALISSAYYFLLADIMTSVTDVTGPENDHRDYMALRDRISKAFMHKWFPDGSPDTASFLSLALATGFDILPEAMDSVFLEELAARIMDQNYHVTTGVVGTNALFSALVRKGYTDLFMRVVTNPEYPSYGNWIINGATTLWQNWDGSQSRNHIMFGFVDEYMYDVLMGLRNTETSAGFHNFILQPAFPEYPGRATASHQSMYGDIISSWQRHGGEVTWNVTIPVNTIGKAVFPTAAHDIEIEGPAQVTGSSGNYSVEIGSGSYHFTFIIE